MAEQVKRTTLSAGEPELMSAIVGVVPNDDPAPSPHLSNPQHAPLLYLLNMQPNLFGRQNFIREWAASASQAMAPL